MIRIVVRCDDAGMAANVGGAVHTEWKTFEVHDANLEAYLKENSRTYVQAQIVGAEIVEPTEST